MARRSHVTARTQPERHETADLYSGKVWDAEKHSWVNDRKPDGWLVIHYRMGSTQYFGPFKTLDEYRRWYREVGKPNGVTPLVTPMWRDVNWNR